MATPKIWYYPSRLSGSTYDEIDLVALSDLQATPIMRAADAISLDGDRWRTLHGGYLSLRIVVDRFTDPVLADQLASWWSHMQGGGACSFAADSDKAWAGYVSSISRGDANIVTGGNAFGQYTSDAATLASGDVVVAQGPNPAAERDYLRSSGLSGSNNVGLTDTARRDMLGPIMVRHKDFYPVLRAPESALSKAAVTHDHRISYTLDAVLVEDMGAIRALSTLGETNYPWADGTGKPQGSQTLDEGIQRAGITPERDLIVDESAYGWSRDNWVTGQ